MLDNKASHKFITISSRLPNPAPAMLVCLSCCSDEQNAAIAAILTTPLSRQLPKHRAAGPAAAAQRPAWPRLAARERTARAQPRASAAASREVFKLALSPSEPRTRTRMDRHPPLHTAPRAVSRFARSGRAGVRVAATRPARPPDSDGSAPHPRGAFKLPGAAAAVCNLNTILPLFDHPRGGFDSEVPTWSAVQGHGGGSGPVQPAPARSHGPPGNWPRHCRGAHPGLTPAHPSHHPSPS